MYNLKSNIDKKIFREYDIRGVYGKDIDDDFSYTFGIAFGSYIQDFGFTSVVVGHDNRLSGENLYKALIEGLVSSGVDVIKLGLVTTPMYYYACIKLDNPSGIMITASHNPAEDNGFKFALDKRGNAKGEIISDFYNYMIKGNFKSGKGKTYKYDIKDDYFKLIDESLNIKENNLKVLIDPGNGTTSIIAKELYSKYINNLISICDESNGKFPFHHPDPCDVNNLQMLKEKVLEENADIGIAFDGDGDRVGVINKDGSFISADKLMIIIIRDMINKVNNKTFLFDIKCSNALKDEITNLGGKYIEYRSGNSYTKAKVHEDNLPFGGEYSGHFFFNDKFPGFDSGLYAGLRILEIMANSNKSIDELLEGINEYFSTGEIKIHSEDEKKFEVIDKLKTYAENRKLNISDIDGVKVLFEDGFAIVRASNTGPNLTMRFESKTKEKLKTLEEEYTNLVNTFNNK